MAIKKRILFYSDKDRLSNFYPYRITIHDPRIGASLTFPTSEHFFQWQKFNYPGASKASLRHAALIRNASTPAEAKRLGGKRASKSSDPVMRSDWDEYRIYAMEVTVAHKFCNLDSMTDYLLGTDDAELLENSPRDSFWGIGKNGKGKNMLGKILMELRDKLNLVDSSPLTSRLVEYGILDNPNEWNMEPKDYDNDRYLAR